MDIGRIVRIHEIEPETVPEPPTEPDPVPVEPAEEPEPLPERPAPEPEPVTP